MHQEPADGRRVEVPHKEMRRTIEVERADAMAPSTPADVDPSPGAAEFEQRCRTIALERVAGVERDLARLESTRAAIAAGQAWIVMPLYPYGPDDLRLDLPENPPNKPSLENHIPLGTDTAGRDVLPLMLYGFRISLAFALVVAAIGYAIGVIVGGMQGYYGGWIDILSQRFVEIWGSIPFLFTIMIIASLVTPSFALLVALMVVLQSWLGLSADQVGKLKANKILG